MLFRSTADQIVQVMEIQAETDSFEAADKIRSAVELFLERNNDGKLGADPKTYERIDRSAHRLLTNLHKLNSSDRRFFAETIGVSVETLERHLEAIERTAESLAPVKRPRGRPKKSYEYPFIRALVRDLDRIAFRCGGKLTLGRNAQRLNGTLPRTLEILHELAPTFVPAPAEISYATLRRMRLTFEEWDSEIRDEYHIWFSDELRSEECQAENA